MSPLPGWVAGAQSVALNFSNVDLPVQLHFALFHGSGGFVLKPTEMCAPRGEEDDDEAFWPALRSSLCRVTIEIISLHQLPQRGERRPHYSGSRGACHRHLPELSGAPAMPRGFDPIKSAVTLSIMSIGGFCVISRTLPLETNAKNAFFKCEAHTSSLSNGFNANVGSTFHCIAEEPLATFLRVAVTNGQQEVAFESAVLGRLKRGFRVLQMRSLPGGTRIELCFILVKIGFGNEAHVAMTSRQMRLQSKLQLKSRGTAVDQIKKLKQELSRLKLGMEQDVGSIRCSTVDKPETKPGDETNLTTWATRY